MADFKESGAIEYTADILLGMWYKGADKKGFDESEAKNKHPREIRLSVLKNRSGRAGSTLDYDYYTMYNFFDEITNSFRKDYEEDEDELDF